MKEMSYATYITNTLCVLYTDLMHQQVACEVHLMTQYDLNLVDRCVQQPIGRHN